MDYNKKLIEVSLPLDDINEASAREKSIRHGHPSTLHLWWARRPLAACRAILFASLVDDPSAHPEKFRTEEAQERERERLFDIIRELVKWENSNNETVLEKARKEIAASTDGNPPAVYDPFAGGGSIPLEAQRLGLRALASDLNPVAVLITKAMIEIPPKFKDLQPVHPGKEQELVRKQWKGAQGLAEDVRYYGKWMRDEAYRRIGKLYPEVTLPREQGGDKASVIAWLWARTVTCPNPACKARMPLVRSFWLSKKKGREAWIEPIVDRSVSPSKISFQVRTGKGRPPESIKVGRGATFKCIACGTVANNKHIKQEGMSQNMGSSLLAIVAEGKKGRVYLEPLQNHEEIARCDIPDSCPDAQISDDRRSMFTPLYGLTHFSHLFTPRQLTALTTFSDLVTEAREKVYADARKAGIPDGERLETGGTGARAYAEAVSTYLAFAIDRLADRASSICSWDVSRDNIRNTFARQAIPMVWDYAESNPFCDSTGNFLGAIQWIEKVICEMPASIGAVATMKNAEEVTEQNCIFSTDPPYYDNIGYADLADFFYIWLRRSLRDVYSELFATMQVPKQQELVATPYRFDGDKYKAKDFFESGLSKVFSRLYDSQRKDFPLTVYYAFKQAESTTDKTNGDTIHASTGWETMLQALIKTGFQVIGTWPIRTELANRALGLGTNALASSIVLVCRHRTQNALTVTRRDFLNELKTQLPKALRTLQIGNIAPVDLAQSAIGPGMAVFSQYSRVLEADGTEMSVRMALGLINQVLDEVLAEQEGEFDPDTRWAVAWFQQYGMSDGPFGEAETLCKAKNVSVQGLVNAGILKAQGGKVRLLSRADLALDWDPATDKRLTVWEAAQYLIQALENESEEKAAVLRARLGAFGEAARDLAYRLYSICEKKGWAQEARSYNTLISSWGEIVRLSQTGTFKPEQGELGIT